MNHADQPKWLTERIDQNSDRVSHSTCPRCGDPVLRARAGRVAALDVVADPTPLTPTSEVLALLAGHITWNLVTIPGLGYQRITWRHLAHIRAGPKPDRVAITDHVCLPQPVQETLL